MKVSTDAEVVSILRALLAYLVGTETCWFCKVPFPMDALIAGYDTFDEQRLACLACNERMRGNWRPETPKGTPA